MKNKHMVTMQQMKDALASMTGSKFPLKFTLANGDKIIRYVRGFADQQRNILLISENAFTLALRIIEVKDIARAEYGQENSEGQWSVLEARWHERRQKA